MMKFLSVLSLLALLFIGCNKEDNEVIHVNCDGIVIDTLGTGDTAKLFIANAFTPNGDGLNDSIKPYTKSIQSISFTVYDYDNNVVFTTTEIGKGWAGSPTASSGTLYYYKIQATTKENHQIGKCGGFFELFCLPFTSPPLFFEDQLTENGFSAPTMESLSNCP